MIPLARISTWEQALNDFILSTRRLPHSYGEHDCCTFISGAIMAMCGDEIDPMGEFRGKYDSLISSVKALKEIGAGDLPSTLDGKFPEIPIGKAKRGDIALCDIADMDAAGVVMGSYAYFVSEDGLERIPRKLWKKAWAIG